MTDEVEQNHVTTGYIAAPPSRLRATRIRWQPAVRVSLYWSDPHCTPISGLVLRRVHLDQRYEWGLEHCRCLELRVRVLVQFEHVQQVDQLDQCGSLQ